MPAAFCKPASSAENKSSCHYVSIVKESDMLNLDKTYK